MVSFNGSSIVACGTLRREITTLADEGLLDADRVFFTAPGLHEWPRRLEKQLARQLDRAEGTSEQVIVVYGGKCFLDPTNAARDTDTVLSERGPGFHRIQAKHCVDMLTSAEERESIADGGKVFWFTPGWVEHWKFIFQDWDVGQANETFPAYDRAVVLDALGYFDELSATDPETILEMADWMRIPLEPYPITLDRLKGLLVEQLQPVP